MKKFKLLLSLGAVAGIAGSVAVVAACGTQEKGNLAEVKQLIPRAHLLNNFSDANYNNIKKVREELLSSPTDAPKIIVIGSTACPYCRALFGWSATQHHDWVEALKNKETDLSSAPKFQTGSQLFNSESQIIKDSLKDKKYGNYEYYFIEDIAPADEALPWGDRRHDKAAANFMELFNRIIAKRNNDLNVNRGISTPLVLEMKDGHIISDSIY